jgi:hypothetical protein
MKAFTILLLIISSIGFAQEPAMTETPKGSQTHDGFYLSLTGGPAFGDIVLEASNVSFKKMEFSGSGFQFDFKIGGVVSEESNLILSFDMISRAISGPSLTVDGVTATTTGDVIASDALYGVGLTKYFMPSNIFISATFGVGVFQLEFNNTKANSETGFAFQLKAGKEWWVSDNWGLGVAAGVASISADDKTDASMPNYSGQLSTTKFFVVFNTTFN